MKIIHSIISYKTLATDLLLIVFDLSLSALVVVALLSGTPPLPAPAAVLAPPLPPETELPRHQAGRGRG